MSLRVRSVSALVGGLLGLGAIIALAISVADVRNYALLFALATLYMAASAAALMGTRPARRALLMLAALAALAVATVTIFSIGLLLIPAALALVIAAIRG